MRKLAVVLGTVLLVAAIFALIVPMWVMTVGMETSAAGFGAIVLMIIFCFGVGGGLMFLIFYSARKGHDEAAHYGAGRRDGAHDT